MPLVNNFAIVNRLSYHAENDVKRRRYFSTGWVFYDILLNLLRVVSSQFLLDAGYLLAGTRIRVHLSILNMSEAKVDLVIIQTLLLCQMQITLLSC